MISNDLDDQLRGHFFLRVRDHTTIIHGHEKIAADMEKNESLRNTVEILMKKISPQ